MTPEWEQRVLRLRNIINNSEFSALDIARVTGLSDMFWYGVWHYIQGRFMFSAKNMALLDTMISLIEGGHVVKIDAGVYYVYDRAVVDPLPEPVRTKRVGGRSGIAKSSNLNFRID
jgi:hypothetical protein